MEDWRAERDPVLPSDSVADEIEAFLQGDLAEWLETSAAAVPSWALLNRLAHADRDELDHLNERELGSADAGSVTGSHRWRAGQLLLADYLLATTSSPEELDRVQREVLVPLELWLIGESRIEPFTPGEIVRLAWETVEEHLLGCQGS
jgi:hypothetical protein